MVKAVVVMCVLIVQSPRFIQILKRMRGHDKRNTADDHLGCLSPGLSLSDPVSGFASTRVICNILTDNAFLGIVAVGMTFVILSVVSIFPSAQ